MTARDLAGLEAAIVRAVREAVREELERASVRPCASAEPESSDHTPSPTALGESSPAVQAAIERARSFLLAKKPSQSSRRQGRPRKASGGQ